MLYLVKYATEKAGRHHTVITNDKQLFKIATQITWWQPDVSKKNSSCPWWYVHAHVIYLMQGHFNG